MSKTKETALELIDLASLLISALEDAEGVVDEDLEALIDHHYESATDKLGGIEGRGQADHREGQELAEPDPQAHRQSLGSADIS